MTQDTIKQQLRAARELIDTPEKWTQGALGRNAEGNSAWDDKGNVVARCATGAVLDACRGDWLPSEVMEIRTNLLRSIIHHETSAISYITVACWNDLPGRQHAEVMLAFDRAIEDVSHEEVVA